MLFRLIREPELKNRYRCQQQRVGQRGWSAGRPDGAEGPNRTCVGRAEASARVYAIALCPLPSPTGPSGALDPLPGPLRGPNLGQRVPSAWDIYQAVLQLVCGSFGNPPVKGHTQGVRVVCFSTALRRLNEQEWMLPCDSPSKSSTGRWSRQLLKMPIGYVGHVGCHIYMVE